jgi:hypothetical protein
VSLSRRVGGLNWSLVSRRAARVTVASAAGGLVMAAILRALEGLGSADLARAGAVLGAAVGGALTFVAAASFIGVDDFERLRAILPKASRRRR